MSTGFFLHYGDLTDMASLHKLISTIRPDEVYNLASQTHVRFSFDHPVLTAESTGVGALRLLDAIRNCGLEKTVRYYQVICLETESSLMLTQRPQRPPPVSFMEKIGRARV